MQKKPGQISSSTLGLRFMQNAARAKQELEVEAAKAKVRTEEEWELPPDVRESWGIEPKTDQQSVSYEQSYIPFLFPEASGEGSSHMKGDAGENHDGLRALSLKGRRKFGKHGREVPQDNESNPAVPPQPIKPMMELPRGARSISSHGRSAPSKSSSASDPSKHVSQPPKNVATTKPPVAAASAAASVTSPHGFMRPNVEEPRPHENTSNRKKRTTFDLELGEGKDTPQPSSEGGRKRKRRKDNSKTL